MVFCVSPRLFADERRYIYVKRARQEGVDFEVRRREMLLLISPRARGVVLLTPGRYSTDSGQGRREKDGKGGDYDVPIAKERARKRRGGEDREEQERKGK
jgi:hypothetical protein